MALHAGGVAQDATGQPLAQDVPECPKMVHGTPSRRLVFFYRAMTAAERVFRRGGLRGLPEASGRAFRRAGRRVLPTLDGLKTRLNHLELHPRFWRQSTWD